MKQLTILSLALLLLLSACAGTPDESTPATALPPPAATTISAPPTTTEPPTQFADAEFDAFYSDFTEAVRNRDIQFIDSILDDEITSSFGGDLGKVYFHEHWKIEKEYYSRDLWAVLDEILAMGGVFYEAGEYNREIDGKCFVAPYIFVDNETEFDGSYRLCNEQKNGDWKLIFLVAGD